MGWKGTMRSLNAACRRMEREQRRRQRELEKQRVLYEKMQEQERASLEAQLYENRIELLLSIHKECGDVFDWTSIRGLPQPKKPSLIHKNEDAAQLALKSFKAGFTDKLFGRGTSKKEALIKAVEDAKTLDNNEFDEALKEYDKDFAEWTALKELAGKILSDDLTAYIDAIKLVDLFSEIDELGSHIDITVDSSSAIVATLYTRGEQVIPSEIKSVTKSGKLSTKAMPKSKFYEIYQDYVCGSVFRVSRELFALLPTDFVIVNAKGNLLNTQTGHMEEQIILSVAIPRKTLDNLNFETLDPSDALNNFVHNMAFKNGKGFLAVESLNISDFKLKSNS